MLRLKSQESPNRRRLSDGPADDPEKLDMASHELSGDNVRSIFAFFFFYYY